jgi:ATP-dependent exoDNAse (exonuclease V) alpha subunit
MQPVGRKRKRSAPTPETDLDPDQRAAVEMVRAGHNVFVTGGPGAGKSHTLRVIVTVLQEKFPGGVLVTAPTGVAALLVGGQTLNSKPGPGVPRGCTSSFTYMLRGTSRDMWKQIRVLVIDEISMVCAEFLEWYAEATMAGHRIQVVLCGDFAQLPPVPENQGSMTDSECLARFLDPKNKDDKWSSTPFGLREVSGRHAFQTAFWRGLNLRVARLTGAHRTTDDVLLGALTDLRLGLGDTPAVRRLVRETARPLVPIQGVVPTRLFPRRSDVASYNTAALQKLDRSTARAYAAKDSVSLAAGCPPGTHERLAGDAFFRECQASGSLELRVGSQVMLVRNEADATITPRLVNGSRGVVVGFRPVGTSDSPVVRFACGREVTIEPVRFEKELYMQGTCVRLQLPLAPAWAVTIHKAQGASIDLLTVDLTGTFADGQAYVAISRASHVDGLQIVGFTPACVRTSRLTREFGEALDSGRLAGFIATVPTWWAPVVADERWRQLYERHPAFVKWQRRFPQK